MLLYCLTAGIAGYVSTNLYLQFGGDKWATNAVLAACLFAVPVFVMFTVNNAIAAAWGRCTAIIHVPIVDISFELTYAVHSSTARLHQRDALLHHHARADIVGSGHVSPHHPRLYASA